MQALETSLNERNDELHLTKAKADQLEESKDVLKSIITTLEIDKKDLVKERDREILQSKQRLSNCEEFNQTLSTSRDNLRSTVDRLRQEISLLDHENEGLKSDSDRHQATASDLDDEAVQHREDKRSLEREKEDLQRRLEVSQNAGKHLEVEKTTLNTHISDLQTKNEDLQKDLASADTQMKALSRERAHLQEAATANENVRADLEAKLRLLESNTNVVESSLTTAKEKVDELELLLENRALDAAVTESQLEGQIYILNSAAEKATTEIAELEGQIESREREARNHRLVEEKVAGLETQLDNQNSKMIQTESNCTHLQDRVAELDAQIAKRNSQVSEAKKSETLSKDRVAKLEAQIDSQERQVLETRELHMTLKDRIADLETQFDTRDTTKASLEKQIEELSGIGATQAAELSACKQSLERLSFDLQEARNRATRDADSLRERSKRQADMDRKLYESEATLEDVKELLETAESDLASVRRQASDLEDVHLKRTGQVDNMIRRLVVEKWRRVVGAAQAQKQMEDRLAAIPPINQGSAPRGLLDFDPALIETLRTIKTPNVRAMLRDYNID